MNVRAMRCDQPWSYRLQREFIDLDDQRSILRELPNADHEILQQIDERCQDIEARLSSLREGR